MTVTVDPTGGLGQAEMLRRLEQVAARAVENMFPGEDVELTHINQSENTTYIADSPSRGKTILRIHRTGYHSVAAVRSEHAWIQALRDDAGVMTPRVLPTPDGETITRIATDELPDGRNCVFFEFLEGDEPDADALLENFPNLGEVTARMHEHARGWALPQNFERFHWNMDTVFGPSPHWGHWTDCPHTDGETSVILTRLVDTLRSRLTRFGMEQERFGLVHADMRLANLLIHQGETRVIDFDDCGFSWYLYDLATAVSFIEDRADMPELIEAWTSGYEKVRRLSDAEKVEIPSFIMLRRMLIVAWIGSHSETELAAELGADFPLRSCDLAEAYLTKLG